jgi:SAM-dependent methyltransferase
MKGNTGDTPKDNLLNSEYWDTRYREGQTGWDLREVSPPIKAYVDQLIDKNIRILIPGCGSGYEAQYLVEKGFNDVTIIDIAPTIVKAIRDKYQNPHIIKIIEGDFFRHEGKYDLILEQTFFCAIAPSRRAEYVKKTHSLLSEEGKLAGLLFNRTFEQQGPPFGGSMDEYQSQFSDYFDILILEPCYNSFEKRVGTELFILLQKKTAG